VNWDKTDCASGPEIAPLPTLRSRLFRKYVKVFMLTVAIALVASGLVEAWNSYRDHTAWLIRIQRGQAEAAAAKIGQFIEQIEAQIAWTTQFAWSDEPLEEQHADASRLLHLVPAIMELARLDSAGHEQLHVSRLAATVLGSNIDLSRDPKFIQAVASGVYRGPVYFRQGTEPYMTLAIGNAAAGATIAEINLGYIWDVVAGIKVGEHGAAYVVDVDGRLIAHPDLALVLRNTDMSGLVQVRAARAFAPSAEPPHRANDISGREVLTASAPIERLGWLVFSELPINEAYDPLYGSLRIKLALLLAGLGLAMLLSLVLAQKMVKPIRTLQTGAARIGAGRLDHRIQIKTGDELEAVGDQFNSMAERLQESYATLEGKVIERTRQLELANLAKTRFLAAASHDLRQPLHALGLLVAQLDGSTKRGERRRIVARVGEAIAAMNELFNALLDISKLDAGAVAPDVTVFPLDPVLRKIETMFATLARDKSLRLCVLPSRAWIRSDRILLERILLNLVSNAVRYTDRGGILVGCRRRDEKWRIEVWDSGIGIPKDQRENIFGEFYRIADAGPGRGGLGLGLAIVARLCRLLGHPLDLASTPGKGSRFAVLVPGAPAQVGAAEAPDPLLAAAQPFAGKLVLVIDDDRLVLDSMGGLLRSWGCQVSGWTSAAAMPARACELHRTPDFIISDYHLAGGETCIELVKRLRSAFRAPIPALFVTGDTSPERKLEAQAAGLELLQKPVPPMILRATLQAMLRPGQTVQPQRSRDGELMREQMNG
jgi:signal transduction histidine kinase/FixJ family two-component response regulator